MHKGILEWDWTRMIALEDAMFNLAHTLDSGRLHPIILLEGLEGIGKRHLAIWLAARMTCQHQALVARPCGKCLSCRDLMRGTHPDVAVLNPEGESIKTADIERLQDHFMVMSPDGCRIGVIMNADRMTIEASNRALKTLEEPAEQVRVILTSSRPLLLPATVLGRCLRWRVQPPKRETVISWFKSLLRDCGRSTESEDLIDQWAMRLRYSPGLLKRELDDSSDYISGIHGEVRELLLAGTPMDVVHAAANLGRQFKAKVPEVLAAIEWELNRMHRQSLSSESNCDQIKSQPVGRADQRRLLREIRQQAVRGKVTLNTQLVAESIGLCGWGS